MGDAIANDAEPRGDNVVDIIIPVYSGVEEVKACLESVLACRNASLGEIIVVNDCSPEPAIHAYLQGLADEGLVTLLVNPENEGFVRTCNRAATVRPERDFVLLNADTEVHGDWLDRMAAHATKQTQVATVTPFSNNATIASYPWGGAQRETAGDIPVADIDDAMRAANSGIAVALPTAIGFCMFVRREAWQAAGGFDERYGRGYGEEVEFCLATAQQGWTHWLACDVFVYHAGGVSFGYESTQLKSNAQQIIDTRYPEFPKLVQDWVKEDPALDARIRCDMERLKADGSSRILHVTHQLGGGVEQHIQDLAKASWQHGQCQSIALRPWGDEALALAVIGTGADFSKRIYVTEAERPATELIAALGIQRLHFHHYAGLPQWVLSLPEQLGLPYDVTVHDFVSACPQFHFQDSAGRYCGRPAVAGCNECIAERCNHWDLEIEPWRALFNEHLGKAQRVICPTGYVAGVINEYYPEANTVVWPHPETIDPTLARHREKGRSRLKVAVVGALSVIKGFDVVEAIIQLAEERDLPLDFVVIGPTIRPFYRGCRALVTGPYPREALPHILLRERADCFLFTPQIPETFSYALTSCLATGLPIVATQVGAFAERLRDIDRAQLLPAEADAETILAALLAQPRAYTVVEEPGVVPVVDVTSEADYVARYLDGIAAAEPNIERLAAALAEIDKTDNPASRAAPPLEELLNAALDQHSSEAKAELRRHVMHTAHSLAQREEHLAVRADEVQHLEHVITDFKVAAEREETHLKAEIAALQASKEADVGHLMQVLEETRQHCDQLVEQQSQLLNRVVELETSTIWLATAPLRGVLHPLKRLFWFLPDFRHWVRKVLVFVRYHYAMGGWEGLRIAIGRRWSRWVRRHGDRAPSPAARATILPKLPDGPIAFLPAEAPQLSIVIPCYGQHQVTADCLRSIYLHPPSVSFEVIVADDAFETPFQADDMGITGVVVLRNRENLGFLRTCNAAVSEARGERILLLNNDTVVMQGAVQAMWDTFDRFSDVGAVGAQLLYPDGRLQEAGGIVWRDGSGWNWGRDEHPTDPRFNYVREADYCSAAALMIDAPLWAEIGGFDERFMPCYYEDTDLCFSISERGRRVLYQPAAKVIHLEGVSHGTDLSQGQKAYQVKNQSTFVTKWEQRLTGHGPNGHNPLRECDRQKRVHVLWVEACMLTPDQDSGSLRTLRLLKLLLSIGCKVTFAADNLLADEPYGQQLRDEGIEVLHSPHVHSIGDYLREHAGRYDIVTLCRHYIAIQYIDELKQRYPDTQVWFDTIDLHYLRLRRQFDLDGAAATQKMAELAYQEECSVIAQSDMTIVVSDVEQAELAREMPNARVTIISNIHEPQEAVSSFENRNGILFVGGFQHPPNVDAVEYYATDIWPAVRAAIPDVETFIVGSRMPQNLKKSGEERGLTMVGFVQDLTPYYANCRLAIAPLRYGAGVKGKVNQALSYGLPVVGSAVSVEGMGLIHKKEVMVADDPESFVSAILEAYSDEDLWQKLSVNGAKSLEGRFTSDVATRTLHAALEKWLDDRERKTAF